MTLTNKSSRIKHWLLAAILFVSTSVSLIPSSVWASPAGGGMDRFTSKNNGYYAGIFLRDCLNQTKQTKAITMPDGSLVANGGDTAALRDYDTSVWASPGVDIGKYYAPADGWLKEGCGKTDTVNTALGNFGYTKLSDFLLGMGYAASGTKTITSGSPITGTLTTIDYPFYVASSAQAVQDKINARISSASYQQFDEDKFFVYDTVFGASGCQLNATVTGDGTKATLVEIVEEPAGSGKFTTKSTDVEFPVTTSSTGGMAQSLTTTKEADKVIIAYDYGGHAGSDGDGKTNDITCAKLLEERNKYANAMANFDNKNPQIAITSSVSASITEGTATNDTTCSGGALGWLMCPLVTVMDNLNKAMAKNIESILQVTFMTDPVSKNALQSIWSLLTGIANLLLVIAFLIVIFSQATSIGLSAYGIKKMLPRIIAAAILINLSFFICGVLIDIFNIIGGAVKGIIDVGLLSIPNPSSATLSTSDPLVSIGSWITVLSGALLAMAGAALLGLLPFILPVIISGAFATLAFFVGISIRLVIIVLLIVISPIAIAAMILPNTEPLFKKWLSSFIKLLALYPIIVAIMYGCALVAKIILVGT